MAATWTSISAGVYGNPELSMKARHLAAKQTRCFEVVSPATDFNIGKNSGDRVTTRIVGRLTTLGDTALTELQPVPTYQTPIFEVTGTIYRRALGVLWTGSRADLDRLSVRDETIKALRDNAARTRNKVIYTALVAQASFGYVATAATTRTLTTDGTVTGTANSSFNWLHAITLVKDLDNNNTPPADGKNFIMIGRPELESDLLLGTAAGQYVDIAKYSEGMVGEVLNGEVGKIGRLRLIVDNDAFSLTAANSNPSGFVCGFEAIKQILGPYPLHFRVQLNVGMDFGNQSGIAWQSMEGFQAPKNFTLHTEGAIMNYGGV